MNKSYLPAVILVLKLSLQINSLGMFAWKNVSDKLRVFHLIGVYLIL